MIIYNVTVNVEEEALQEWLTWMKETHIPDMMRTGMFLDHNFSRLITRQDDETGATYVVQYLCESMDQYEKYQAEFAHVFQEESQKKFGGKFIAFRTLMEKVW